VLLRASHDEPDARAARILDLGRKISSALPPDGFRLEDLYDDSGLPT